MWGRGHRSDNRRETETLATGHSQSSPLASAQAARAEAGVDELIDAEIQQGQTGADQRNANARRHEPVPLTGERSVVRLGPEEHGAPIPYCRARQTDVG